MTLTVKVTVDTARPMLEKAARSLTGFGVRAINRAMAMEFREITWKNMGPTGVDRPEPWAPLSKAYSRYLKRMGFPYPDTPTLLRTGRLMQSIHVKSDNDEYAEVFSQDFRAPIHQFGYRNIPKRGFFPWKGDATGGPTEYSLQRMKGAAEKALARMLGLT